MGVSFTFLCGIESAAVAGGSAGPRARSTAAAYHGAMPESIPSHGTRYATCGMVASLSPEAAAAGVRVMLDGGNAFDAAIATALVEGITLPGACGLGADAFMVLHDARTGEMHAINGSGIAAQAA